MQVLPHPHPHPNKQTIHKSVLFITSVTMSDVLFIMSVTESDMYLSLCQSLCQTCAFHYVSHCVRHVLFIMSVAVPDVLFITPVTEWDMCLSLCQSLSQTCFSLRQSLCQMCFSLCQSLSQTCAFHYVSRCARRAFHYVSHWVSHTPTIPTSNCSHLHTETMYYMQTIATKQTTNTLTRPLTTGLHCLYNLYSFIFLKITYVYLAMGIMQKNTNMKMKQNVIHFEGKKWYSWHIFDACSCIS